MSVHTNIQVISHRALMGVFLFALAFISALHPSVAFAAKDAFANIAMKDGTELGRVDLQETPAGVLFTIGLTGLVPGPHSIHIHETGSCEENFMAADGHFNPDGKQHGFDNPAGPHAGDMPNIYAMEGGAVRSQILNARVSLSGSDASLLDDDGSAIIVHQDPDSHEADAGAGARIACGVIRK